MRIIIYLLLFLIFSCSDKNKTASNSSIPFSEEIDIDDDFYFEKGVYQVIDNVYVAIGYGLANSVLIVGDTSNIIIDTTEDPKLGAQINAEFKKISNLPNEAIIYTHSHVDHWRGAPGFYEEDTKVYAHSTFEKGFFDQNNLLRPILTERGMKQFGHFLPDSLKRGHGLGFTLNFDFEQPAVIYPTNFFYQKTSQLSVGGIDLEIQHTPGETDDQIIIYYPEKDVVISADNYYMRFPNLYTIRGTSYRDTKSWYKSVDAMRSYSPKFLISCHGPFLSGEKIIEERLSIYRDAIQYIHDQTIRLMNAGYYPDEISEMIELPQDLSSSPFLYEFYGTVRWSVKSIFNGYLGWFNGNPADLDPLSRKEEAQKFAKLVGGEAFLLNALEKSVLDEDMQWALELSDKLIALDFEVDKVNNLRQKALLYIGLRSSNPNKRNYFLSSAMELDDDFDGYPIAERTEEGVKEISIDTIFSILSVRLNPERVINQNIKACFLFSSGLTRTITIRNQVASVSANADLQCDITVKTSELNFKMALSGLLNPVMALASGDIVVDGGNTNFLKFLSYFR